MADRLELLKEARAARGLASRTLKRSLNVSDDGDKERLRRNAERLRQEASELEQRAKLLQDAPIF